jgi:L-ascorbate metabolism protein UlaG (beta-lactamase superfamily)
MNIRITHVGTATLILDIGGTRILTDPAFDPSGTQYAWAPVGANSTKTESPAISLDEVGEFDVALVTHAQHDDNLDPSGRSLLPRSKRVFTTRPSARRLGWAAEGLKPWESVKIIGHDGLRIRITATPARHGPPLSLPFVGEVIGFILQWEGQRFGSLYISGDTVLFGGIHEVAAKFPVSLALLHMGEAKFPIMGPFRLTMNGKQAAQAAKILKARTVVPIHYDGWTHFSEPQQKARLAFEKAQAAEQVHWIPKGKPIEFEI